MRAVTRGDLAPCLLTQGTAQPPVSFTINTHFLRYFQQRSAGLAVLSSHLSPQPGDAPHLLVNTSNSRGGWFRALEPHVTPIQSALMGRSGKVSMAVHLMWVSPQALIPNGQNQHPKSKTQPGLRKDDYTTQPLPALFSLGFWSKPQPTIFEMLLAKGPSHQAGDTDGHGLVHGQLPQARRWQPQPPREVVAFQRQIARKQLQWERVMRWVC